MEPAVVNQPTLNSTLTQIADLYDRGLYLQAYKRAQSLGAFETWPGASARVLAGRLARVLGAEKAGRQLIVSAWRRERHHSEARYFYARRLMDERGPLRTWHFLRTSGDTLPGASARLQSDWLALHALTLGQMRDFDRAEEWLARAEKTDPENPWVQVERAGLMEIEDRYEEALVATQQALVLHPWFRAAVQQSAHLLALMDQEPEAVAMLREASTKLECCWVLAQLAHLETELGQYAEAQQSIERFAELSPLMEPGTERWLNEQRSELAYLSGDYEGAIRYAEKSDSPFFRIVTERMKSADASARRVLLPVGFVRQHHMTCAPATLSTISRYWKVPADHLSVAEAICYDGTSAQSERKWAEENGWAAREFTVTWENTVALIDRGIPFTLVTVDPGNAHMQAVIGYDSRRGTILIRDPYVSSLNEASAKELLERQRASGPRGMALVPQAKADLLDRLMLTDASLYDLLYALHQSLLAHQREKAEEHLQSLMQAVPDHRLTLQAQRAVASYDQDNNKMLAAVERLLAQYPEDVNLKLVKGSLLRTLSRATERLEFLKSVCEQKDSDPLFWQQYAEELSNDARQHPEALRLLRRAFRYRPLEPGNFHLLAGILWQQRRLEEALELYRLAACLKATDEGLVSSWFTATRYFKQTEQALQFLRDRFRRFGKKSGYPVRTLSWALDQMEQSREALDVLRAGMELLPEDGELQLYAADMFARQGDYATAVTLLTQAEGRAPQSQWLRTAAGIAGYRGELHQALVLWQRVGVAEPMALDAARNTARLLAETENQAAAIQYLRNKTVLFPHNYALQQLLVEWLREDGEACEPAVRRLLEIDPADAWAHRELAMLLGHQRRFDEAFVVADLARELDPENPSYYCVLGRLYVDAGNIEDAKSAFRLAIRLSVDNDYAINSLFGLLTTAKERRDALEFVRQELLRQVIFGDGLLAWRAQANETLEPEECLALLQSALDARPDLWHAWSAVVQQLGLLQRTDEALQLATEATQRFPLTPRIWLDLSLVHQARLNRRAEIVALEQALSINPGWGYGARCLSEAYQYAGEMQKARELLERAITHAPLDPYNHGCLAEVLWKLGEKEAAVKSVQHATTLEPGYDWAWNSLRDWSQQLDRPELAAECARHLTQQRSGEARSWIILARTLTDDKNFEERLQALERAMILSPRSIEAHKQHACLLAEAKRWDEARAACQPEIFGDSLPTELRNIAAWIEAERGNGEEAIRLLRILVSDEPNYYSAWVQLADWARENQQTAEYMEAAQAMTRLAPNYAVAFGYLGDALMRSNRGTQAKDALHRAMMLDPEYEFAGRSLFNLHLEAQEWESAAAALEILRQHVGGDTAVRCELRYAFARDDFEAAAAHFRTLCLSPTADEDLLLSALAYGKHRKWKQLQADVLKEVLPKAEVSPQLGGAYVRWLLDEKKLRACRRFLDGLTADSPLWESASIAWLEINGEGEQKKQVRWWLKRHQRSLCQRTGTWGNAGAALQNIRDYRAAIAWFADWQQRENVRPWMLWHYAHALCHLDQWEKASEIGRAALQLPEDRTVSSHRLMLALHDALRGDDASAEKKLSQIQIDSDDNWDGFIYEMLSIFLSARISGKAVDFQDVVERLLLLGHRATKVTECPMLMKAHYQLTIKAARSDGSAFRRLLTSCRLEWLRWAKFCERNLDRLREVKS